MGGEKQSSSDPFYLLTEGETIGQSAGSWYTGEPGPNPFIYALEIYQGRLIYLLRDSDGTAYRHICQYNSHPNT